MIPQAQADLIILVLKTIYPNAISFDDDCFRCASPKYSSVNDFFSGGGSKFSSGRYHTAGAFAIVYSSLRPEWAIAEYSATAKSIGLRPASLFPLVTAAAHLRLHRVLDLTNTQITAQLQITTDELIKTVWSGSTSETMTQFIGRTACQLGYEAMLVPSSDGRINLNFFPDNIKPPSKLEIVNSDQLPSGP